MTEKRKEYMKEWRKKNKEHIQRYQKKYYKKHPWYKTKGQRGELIIGGPCGFGRKYELIALSILADSKDANEKNFLGKFDIEWRGKKIEVKVRNPYPKKESGWRFSFTDTKRFDYALLFCLHNKKIEKVLLIPSDKICKDPYIGRKSKYDKYIIR